MVSKGSHPEGPYATNNQATREHRLALSNPSPINHCMLHYDPLLQLCSLSANIELTSKLRTWTQTAPEDMHRCIDVMAQLKPRWHFIGRQSGEGVATLIIRVLNLDLLDAPHVSASSQLYFRKECRVNQGDGNTPSPVISNGTIC